MRNLRAKVCPPILGSPSTFICSPRLQLRLSSFRNTSYSAHTDVHQAILAATNDNIDHSYQGADARCAEGDATGA